MSGHEVLGVILLSYLGGFVTAALAVARIYRARVRRLEDRVFELTPVCGWKSRSPARLFL
jgi:hypothetical protein